MAANVTELRPDQDETGALGLELSDEELTALALAADPDAPLNEDAVPFQVPLGGSPALPGWYMPAVTAHHVRGWRVPVVVLLVASFLLIDALGLCMTYGWVGAA